MMVQSRNTISKELADLEKMSAKELRSKYSELFGDESRSGNRQWLYRRCAWRLQELVQGGLSERARKRAMQIANDSDIRFIPPRNITPDKIMPRKIRSTDMKPNDRLPIVNTILTREFKGKLHTVTVLPKGFEYDGNIYQSLTAVAHAITGSHWNGYHFFSKSLTNAKKLQETK